MIGSDGKYIISLSEELSFHIKRFLIKSGISKTEAESLSKKHQSIKSALKYSSLHIIYPKPKGNREDLEKIISSKAYDNIKQEFPMPWILSEEKINLPPLKELRIEYQKYIETKKKAVEFIYPEEKKTEIVEISEKRSPEFEQIIKIALDSGYSQEEAEVLAAGSDSFQEACEIINESRGAPQINLQQLLGLNTIIIPGLPGLPGLPRQQQYGNSGEVFIYTISNQLDTNTCMICGEDFIMKQKLSALYCTHIFHNECIGKWFENDVKMRCPSCNRGRNEIDMLAQ